MRNPASRLAAVHNEKARKCAAFLVFPQFASLLFGIPVDLPPPGQLCFLHRVSESCRRHVVDSFLDYAGFSHFYRNEK
ncbi:MAG: hypothetical protein AMS22_08515 [Thiotrichales bacterium SG8_50]|nr:MAG: hypothetical protein AMS22_08515 [Thiotrichales bacterium SG8_50]